MNWLIIFKLLKFFFIGLGVGTGLWIMSKLKPFFIWIKGGVEDGDGKLTNKELQVAFFSTLAAFIVISIPVIYFVFPENSFTYPESVVLGVFALAGATYAVNRAADAYKNGNGNSKPPTTPPPVKPKEESKEEGEF